MRQVAPRLRIAIATAGRFHVLDLARELAALGHEVRFYSYVPRRRAERFGLPRECHRALLPFVFPILLLQRFGLRLWRKKLDHLMNKALNRVVQYQLEPCDIFICMSGIYLEAAVYAKDKYNALIYLERGSRHIVSQKEILDALIDKGFSAGTVDDLIVGRELVGYTTAYKISVPSLQVEQSFLEKGIQKKKIFRNPYGVDLDMFPITPAPPREPAVLLFVGTWTYRKGVDILVQAMELLGEKVQLVHVGPVGDAVLPDLDNFEHYDAVPQWKLTDFYAQAHLFVLASREEGFSLVLFQALASGLPIVASDRTGGEDLWAFIPDKFWVKIVPGDDTEALTNGIHEMLPHALKLKGARDLLGESRGELSWASYGRRYSDELILNYEHLNHS